MAYYPIFVGPLSVAGFSGMAGSGRLLASIQDKSIHLAVFEKMLKGNVSFEHFMFQMVLLSSKKRYGSKTEDPKAVERRYKVENSHHDRRGH